MINEKVLEDALKASSSKILVVYVSNNFAMCVGSSWWV